MARSTLVVAVLLAACAGRQDAAPAADTALTPSQAATSQAGMAMTGRAMLPKMQAHYDSAAAKPSMLMADGVADMTRGMVNAMTADLRTAGMANDGGYMALSDSVLADLDRLPTLSGGSYDGAARAHLDRVHRLMASYERMVPGK